MNKKKSLIKKPKLENKKIKEIKNDISIIGVDDLMKTFNNSPAVQAEEPPKKRKKKKSLEEKEHYVNGREFEDAITAYYTTDKITNYLGDSLRKIACGLSYAPNFINYSFKEDMIGDAIVKMYQALKHKKFKLNHGFSPFSYFTTIAFHAFISRIKKEKKHHQVVEDYKERQYTMLINCDEEMGSHKVYTKPTSFDNDTFTDP
jgi:hypothetical protein